MMNFFLMISFYSFSASIIFTYGIGLERLFIYSKNPKGIFTFLIKNLVLSIISISFLWPLNKFILEPLHLTFFMPIFIIIFLLGLDYAFYKIFPKFELHKNEIIFSFGPIFLIFFTAISFIEAITIILVAQINLLVISFLLNTIKEKIDEGYARKALKEESLILISMGFLLSAFYFII